jgi:hypothetical protein
MNAPAIIVQAEPLTVNHDEALMITGFAPKFFDQLERAGRIRGKRDRPPRRDALPHRGIARCRPRRLRHRHAAEYRRRIRRVWAKAWAATDGPAFA